MAAKRYNLGIIAYGSLIDEPGPELGPAIKGKMTCITPFNVEYSRVSKTRNFAPTLIPVDSGGSPVDAVLLILNDDIHIDNAMSMLWRRETRKTAKYSPAKRPSQNSVVIEVITGYNGFNHVLYTRIGANIDQPVTGAKLAKYAIRSIQSEAGVKKMDGVRYLADAVRNGIITPLTSQYVDNILAASATLSLDETIQRLDRLRIEVRFAKYLPDAPPINHIAVANLINEQTEISRKLAIFGDVYGFLNSSGRIYTRDEHGNKATKILCCCSNCKIDDDGFDENYKLYEPLLKSEVMELRNLIECDIPYARKLFICDKIFDGKPSEYTFSDEDIQILLVAQDGEDIRTENEFNYNKILRLYYKQRSGFPKYFEQDYETRKAKYVENYARTRYKTELKTKEIATLRNNELNFRDAAAATVFDRMIYGELIDYSAEVFEFKFLVSLVAATEDYLYLQFLEEYSGDLNVVNTSQFYPIKDNANMAEPSTLPDPNKGKIKVFVTYAWEGHEHNERVISFTDYLRKNGFDAFNDTYLIQQSASADLQAMMLKNIHEANKVIVILSEKYAEKANKLEGGVGIEYQLILKDIHVNPNKYILASFDPYKESLFPLSFRKREMVALTHAGAIESLFRKLKHINLYQFSEVANTTPALEVKAIPAFDFKTKHAVDVTMPDSYDDDKPNVWDIQTVESDFAQACNVNDVVHIKKIIQKNSFLLYDIYERKAAALPIFNDLIFGKHSVDFAWLNDSSGGPEWVLLRIAQPSLGVVDIDGIISEVVLKEIEAVKGWENYFEINPAEKNRIFGAVANFKFQLIIGRYEDWQTEHAQQWRRQHNKNNIVEIRSYNTFTRSIAEIKARPVSFYRFNQFHQTSPKDKLEEHWKSYRYMDSWRKWL